MIVGRPAPPSRIAVVHLDAAQAEATAALLRPAGHRVSALAQGEDLLARVRSTRPELLVVSAALRVPRPGALVRQVRREQGELPVLVLLGEDSSDDIVEADALLREPLHPGELDLLAGVLLRGRSEVAHLARRLQEVSALFHLAGSLALETGPEALYAQVSAVSARLLHASKAMVVLYDRVSGQFVGQPLGHGLSRAQVQEVCWRNDAEARGRWHFRRHGPLVALQVASDPRLPAPLLEVLQADSLLAVPITRGPRILGLLLAADPSQPFDEHAIGVLRDVAGEAAVAIENQRLHQELKRAHAVLQEHDRITSDFVGIIAHDFRQPLTAIRGFAELLLAHPQVESATAQEYLRTVMSETDALARLAEDTLLITRLEGPGFELQAEQVEIAPLLLESIPADATEHTVLVDVPPGLCGVRGDRFRLRQVVGNLVSNAVRYSRPGTTVTVSCREQRGGWVRLEVADEGLGVPHDQLPRLFQKFQRVRTAAHQAVAGTGLGLYICRLIVEAHGGRIWAEPREAGGTTFALLLPAAPRREEVEVPQALATASEAAP